mmetsp:Transcript_38390/g.83083  ORF Transcript_38390/g.83083 Transcript_38390/m.83083 type:complete len:548 (-) Transcript_38390:124-1767(-)|eukprot:CAMPEP_0206601074 /NCGR_PEP_ID=MMETSP0325_2-20121206/46329_1 /ASSEMBLY_ACC=CAM_ASM_000347 /TAXON_ID=2866 /ORGANISM="Crypthecodinium cohnii, Strain Seligo" /LENGTH=547 /DNA_ID=CAMNT_0054112809 /DNA_START=96 /DNA_END=1739 /DNA_ORIENTATION=+
MAAHRRLPSLPPPLEWAFSEEAPDLEVSLRRRLRGCEAGDLPIISTARAIQSGQERLQASLLALTSAWGRTSLVQFDSIAATLAIERGAPAWAVRAVRESARLVAEGAWLGRRAEEYLFQLAVGFRESRGVLRLPLLWMLDRLQILADQAEEHTGRLEAARTALEEAAVAWTKGGAMPSGEVLHGRKDWDEDDEEDDERDDERLPAVILEAPAQLRRLPESPWGALAVTCLETLVDAAVVAWQALGMRAVRSPIPPISTAALAARSAPEELPRDRPSRWLAVAEILWDGAARACDEFGTSCRFPGLFSWPRLTVGYWNIRGLGAPLRMMCAFKGIECEDVRYDLDQREGKWQAPGWESRHKLQLQEINPFVELPFVANHRTGEVASLTIASTLYLANLFGMTGPTKHSRYLNEQLLFFVYTSWMELRALVYPSNKSGRISGQSFPERVDRYFSTVVPPLYSKLETLLRRRGTGLFVAWLPCAADFHIWELIDQHELLAEAQGVTSLLRKYSALKVFHGRVRSHPRLEGYFESPAAQLPVNNKVSYFH